MTGCLTCDQNRKYCNSCDEPTYTLLADQSQGCFRIIINYINFTLDCGSLPGCTQCSYNTCITCNEPTYNLLADHSGCHRILINLLNSRLWGPSRLHQVR